MITNRQKLPLTPPPPVRYLCFWPGQQAVGVQGISHICSLTSGFQINCFQINMHRHSWGLLSLQEPWVKVLQLRLASVPTEPQLSRHSTWRQGHHDSVMSKFLLVKSFLYILEDCWYAECSNQLTVVRQFPEHLDLQLVVMVMRGSDL